MNQFFTDNKDLINSLLQLVLIIVPVVVTWFIRNYVKGAKSEKDIAAIVQLSNSAIDFVENLDSQGKLNLPPDMKKGAYKLQLGSQWLVGELDRAGIKMTDEQAQTWLASEFQKRMGEVRPTKDIAEVTQAAVDLILRVQHSGGLQIPPGNDQITYLAELAADWILTHLPANWTNISRDEATTWARAELLQRVPLQPATNPVLSADAGTLLPPTLPVQPQPATVTLPPVDRLAQLANQAILFANQSTITASSTVKPIASTTDLAIAWLLTEATRQSLPVTADQVTQAVNAAISARQPAPA